MHTSGRTGGGPGTSHLLTVLIGEEIEGEGGEHWQDDNDGTVRWHNHPNVPWEKPFTVWGIISYRGTTTVGSKSL